MEEEKRISEEELKKDVAAAEAKSGGIIRGIDRFCEKISSIGRYFPDRKSIPRGSGCT